MIRRQTLVAAAVGAAAVVLGGVVVALLVLEFGWFDIAAGDAHFPFVRRFVHGVMVHGVAQRSSDVSVPASVPVAAVASGLCAYRQHCQMCHGGPAVARDHWADGLNPTPPYLIDARARWKPRELYWIVERGVKMTAMPAWRMSMSDKKIWSIVAYLENMARIAPGSYRGWAVAGVCPSATELLKAFAAPQNPPATSLPRVSSAPRAK